MFRHAIVQNNVCLQEQSRLLDQPCTRSFRGKFRERLTLVNRFATVKQQCELQTSLSHTRLYTCFWRACFITVQASARCIHPNRRLLRGFRQHRGCMGQRLRSGGRFCAVWSYLCSYCLISLSESERKFSSFVSLMSASGQRRVGVDS